MGVGAWSWGDKQVWGYGKGYSESDIDEAFEASVKAGVVFVDTAELYGRGVSEKILGRLAENRDIVIATKFLPIPPRMAGSLPKALDASLKRLRRQSVELYQIHWSVPWMPIDRLMARLADAVESKKAKAVGVSNYSARQTRQAHAALAARGVPLASNQVEYSLLHRSPEADGVLETCRELGVTLIAYSPLAMGALSGKYSTSSKPSGARRLFGTFRGKALDKAAPVILLTQEIARRHDRTPSQVALRWLIQQAGVIPIPGAKNAQQATENAGALLFELTPAEVDALERESRPWKK
jgi:aryl-alcohol dehydrogenase-like predicted oxidoreductase